jgi:hypothetical protein
MNSAADAFREISGLVKRAAQAEQQMRFDERQVNRDAGTIAYCEATDALFEELKTLGNAGVLDEVADLLGGGSE